MNKTELIEKIAEGADLSKAAAGRVLEIMHEAITEALIADGKVVIADWGTYAVSQRAARSGRNPQTGETIQIAASTSVKFKAGKKLKDAVSK